MIKCKTDMNNSFINKTYTYPEQIDNCKWFLSEFLSTCGSSVNKGHAPVTLTLNLYDTWTIANPVPVALIWISLTFLGNWNIQYINKVSTLFYVNMSIKTN